MFAEYLLEEFLGLMEFHSARLLHLRVLIGCLVAVVAAAQTPTQLKVFRGTVVHSRVPAEMEVLEDYLIGFDESNYGTVSCRDLGIHTVRTTVARVHYSALRPMQQDVRSFV